MNMRIVSVLAALSSLFMTCNANGNEKNIEAIYLGEPYGNSAVSYEDMLAWWKRYGEPGYRLRASKDQELGKKLASIKIEPKSRSYISCRKNSPAFVEGDVIILCLETLSVYVSTSLLWLSEPESASGSGRMIKDHIQSIVEWKKQNLFGEKNRVVLCNPLALTSQDECGGFAVSSATKVGLVRPDIEQLVIGARQFRKNYSDYIAVKEYRGGMAADMDPQFRFYIASHIWGGLTDFILLHESAHILLGHSNAPTSLMQEKKADIFAIQIIRNQTDQLMPPEVLLVAAGVSGSIFATGTKFEPTALLERLDELMESSFSTIRETVKIEMGRFLLNPKIDQGTVKKVVRNWRLPIFSEDNQGVSRDFSVKFFRVLSTYSSSELKFLIYLGLCDEYDFESCSVLDSDELNDIDDEFDQIADNAESDSDLDISNSIQTQENEMLFFLSEARPRIKRFLKKNKIPDSIYAKTVEEFVSEFSELFSVDEIEDMVSMYSQAVRYIEDE